MVKICADARDCQGPNGCPALEIPSGVHLRVSVHSVPMCTDVYRCVPCIQVKLSILS